jgi:hypothetical protein
MNDDMTEAHADMRYRADDGLIATEYAPMDSAMRIKRLKAFAVMARNAADMADEYADRGIGLD